MENLRRSRGRVSLYKFKKSFVKIFSDVALKNATVPVICGTFKISKQILLFGLAQARLKLSQSDH
jgi:hypothetical protein